MDAKRPTLAVNVLNAKPTRIAMYHQNLVNMVVQHTILVADVQVVREIRIVVQQRLLVRMAAPLPTLAVFASLVKVILLVV